MLAMRSPCRPIAKLAAAFLAGALASLGTTVARADDVDQAIQKLSVIDQRVHIMALEFYEAPRPRADLAIRRLVDAQELLGLGRTNEAATLLVDVIIRWPRTLAARDATFLLGDALYELRDLLSARRYYEQAVSRFSGTAREQRALVRLFEIALATRDFEHVDRYLALLAKVPAAALEPAVTYVKGKLLYQRDDLDEARRMFASVSPTSRYAWRARYFIGTILVKKGDLGGAARAYEALLQSAPPDNGARDIQDLARLALARISYQQGNTARAVASYRSIRPDSKARAEALYELGWTYVRSKNFEKAHAVFAELLRVQPEGPQAPEVKLLVANLHLRQGDLAVAQGAFKQARDELEPTYLNLQAVIGRSQTDPLFLETLTNRNHAELDLAAYVPASARNWVRADPEVERLLTLAGDVGNAEQGVADATDTLERIETVLADGRRDPLALFLDLRGTRLRSAQALAALMEIRDPFASRAQQLEQTHLLAEEAQLLARNAAERADIEQQLGARLASDAPPVEYSKVPANPRTPSSPDPVGQLRTVVLRLDGPLPRARFDIAERAATPRVLSGERERAVAKRLQQLFGQEQQLQQQVLTRMSPEARKQVDRQLEVVSRAEATVSQLLALDARLDAEAAVRVAALEDVVAERRQDMSDVDARLTGVVGEARNLGGILARVMYTRVADRLYDLIVRADVGLIDVAWGAKDRSTGILGKWLTKKNAEQDVLHSELMRQEAALAKRLKAADVLIKTHRR